MKRSFSICLLFLFSVAVVFAQTTWQMDVERVDSSGYYNIQLGQTLIGQSKDINLSDLRILDKENREIPYFLRTVNPVQEISQFEEYVLAENRVKDSLNIITVDNRGKESISRFYIVVRRASVNKYVTLRGSNDKKQWYIVKEKSGVSGFENSDEVLILDFPEGNYNYYEIVLENSQKSPLEVLKVGKIRNSSIYGRFIEVDLGSFVQETKSDKKTYISFPGLTTFYRIGKLEVEVANASNYLRHTRLEQADSNNYTVFDLSSKKDNTFFINDYIFNNKTKLVIENEDNPALTITKIKAYGLDRYVCAYLEKGEHYTLQVSGRNSPANYDIGYFRNDIPSQLPVLKSANLKVIEQKTEEQKRELSWIEKPVFLWSAIIIIGLFLAFICLRMIKEMQKRKPDA